MKNFYLLLLAAAPLFFTQCVEEELFTESSLATDIQLNSARTQDVRVPEITKVSASGSKVTIEFTNYGSPKGPEGGYELMINEKRTYTNVTPRLYSSDKNVKMTFSTNNPGSNSYQVYARWNSGYKRSNSMKIGSESTSSTPPAADDDSNEGDSENVQKPSNAKEPVISKLSFSGSTVTLEFVNFASPSQPEGGFELMIDGKRTGTSIIPRVYSKDRNPKMVFSISNPDDRCYQVYARWNSGYIGSEEVCREGGQSSGSSSPTDDGEDDKDGGDDSGDNSNLPSGLPSLKLLRGYEFNSNIGGNVSQSRDGLKVHHLGRQDGKIVRKDGENAYHVRITPGSYSPKDYTYRLELIPRNLPSPYFNDGRVAKWDQEYIYEIRLQLGDNHEIGSDYANFMSFKNDYTVYREASHTTHIDGDHLYMRHMYATTSGAGSNAATRKHFYYSKDGKRLYPNKDFSSSKRTGSGYTSIESEKGKWVTWTYHVRWSYGSNGFFKIYKNGKLFHSYNGPNSYKDSRAPYVKFGLYNSHWKNGQRTGSTEQEVYIDYMRVYVPK